MSVGYYPEKDNYFTCTQCGYPDSSSTVLNGVNKVDGGCYTGDCRSTDGRFFDCAPRERLRDFYAANVQGGTATCKNQRTDVMDRGMRVPFATYAINYFGDLDPYRERPYDTGFGNVGIAIGGEANPSERAYDSFGHYTQNTCLTNSCQFTPSFTPGKFGCSGNYQTPLMILPVPGEVNAKTLSSMDFPGLGTTVCTSKI